MLRQPHANYCFQLSSSGATLALSLLSGHVSLFDTGSGRETTQIAPLDPVIVHTQISGSSVYVAHPNCIRHYDMRSGPVSTLDTKGIASFHYMDRLLAIGHTRDSTTQTGDIQLYVDGQPLALLDDHSDDITAVCLHSSGRALVSGCTDGMVHLYNTQADIDECLYMQMQHESVMSVGFVDTDGVGVVAASHMNTVRAWMWEDALEVAKFSTDSHLLGVSLDEGCQVLVSNENEGSALGVDLFSGFSIGKETQLMLNATNRGSDWVTDLLAVPQGLVASFQDGTASIQPWQV